MASESLKTLGDGGGITTDDLPRSRRDLDHVFSLAYEELRRIARSVVRKDPHATLNPTALVNEAWFKLAATPGVQRSSHLHFRRIAARAMRQILIEGARRRQAQKRGGRDAAYVLLDQDSDGALRSDGELIALDAALKDLSRLESRQAAVVEARFFGGLQTAEVAEVLGVSEATVLRDWRSARAWLALQLRRGA